jgi:outer membrane protein OmpA-like peptidoglycan-associated protein
MTRIILAAVLLLLAVIGGGPRPPLELSDAPSATLGKMAMASAGPDAALAADAKTISTADKRSAKSPFDVALVAPNGTSVFAGKTLPNSWVTVLADGSPVGSIESDGNGEWSLATDKRLPASPKLSVTVGPRPLAPTVEKTMATLPGGELPHRANTNQRQVAAVGQEVVKRLEELVASASQSAQPSATAAVDGPNAAPPKPETGIAEPVPVHFRFREAAFTEEGRRSAELLIEYLRLTQLNAITLTGHADERGSAELNMELSSQRLEAVSRFLRKGGYAGRLELLPKGKSEPFTGVDRSTYSLDVLWQLDRRVELSTRTN